LVDELSFETVRELISQMAKVKNRLQELNVIRNECEITAGYTKWFCSKKYGLELCNSEDLGYDALSKYGEKIQIKGKIGSDIDFRITFDGIHLNDLDYLFAVFIDEKTWMIDSIYKVPHNVVKDFLTVDPPRRFKWRGESRSLSLQLYPDEDNMIIL